MAYVIAGICQIFVSKESKSSKLRVIHVVVVVAAVVVEPLYWPYLGHMAARRLPSETFYLETQLLQNTFKFVYVFYI